MKNKELYDEQQIANLLRNELMQMSTVQAIPEQKQEAFENIEMISLNRTKPAEEYISPIMTMSEDEILNFVEEFDVGELATLSVTELNHIGEVLGVEPKILFGLEDI